MCLQVKRKSERDGREEKKEGGREGRRQPHTFIAIFILSSILTVCSLSLAKLGIRNRTEQNRTENENEIQMNEKLTKGQANKQTKKHSL